MTGCQRRSVSLSSSILPLCHGRGSHRTLQENSVCSSRCRPPSAPHDFVTHQMTDHRETAHLCPRVFELSGFYTRQYGGSVWKSNASQALITRMLLILHGDKRGRMGKTDSARHNLAQFCGRNADCLDLH